MRRCWQAVHGPFQAAGQRIATSDEAETGQQQREPSQACDSRSVVAEVACYFDATAWVAVLQWMNNFTDNSWSCSRCGHNTVTPGIQKSKWIQCDHRLSWIHYQCAAVTGSPGATTFAVCVNKYWLAYSARFMASVFNAFWWLCFRLTTMYWLITTMMFMVLHL